MVCSSPPLEYDRILLSSLPVTCDSTLHPEFRNSIKAAICADEPSLGSWITIGHPAVAEMLALAGFGFLVVDLEHSVIGLGEMQTLFQAAESGGATPMVRVTENHPKLISRVMDAGAHGVIVPRVKTAKEAERAVSAVRYPPEGTRGVGLARAQGYGLSFESYRSSVNREAMVVVQIEHRDGVERIDEILSVDGVDAYFIGPYDLSASLGVAGEFDHPDVRKSLEHVRAVGHDKGVPAGYHVVEPDPDEALARIAEGYRLVAFSVDMLFLLRTASDGLNRIREGMSR